MRSLKKCPCCAVYKREITPVDGGSDFLFESVVVGEYFYSEDAAVNAVKQCKKEDPDGDYRYENLAIHG